MAAATSVLALAAAFASTGDAATIEVRAPTFTAPPQGWRTVDSRPGTLGRHRPAQAYATALSWSYRPNSYGWASAMPRDGMAVNIILFRGSGNERFLNLCRYTPHVSGFPRIQRLPLRLPKSTGDRLEGAPGVLEYRVFGRLNEWYNVDLRADVKSLRPGRGLLRRAQFVVSHVRFPPWPRVERC